MFDYFIKHLTAKNNMSQKISKNLIILICVNIVFVILTITFAVLHNIFRQGWMLSVYITFLTISYHFAMRLMVGELVTVIYRDRKFNLDSPGFHIYKFEEKLYRILKVKKWKIHMITAKPEQFDLSTNSMEVLLHNMAQAELVHRIIMVLSFVPVLFIIPYGVPAIFITTSLVASLIDLLFVIMQRYNRPRVMRILKMRS